jgi:serine/threonine protein kinase
MLVFLPFVAVVLAIGVGYWTRREVARTIDASLTGELTSTLEANVTALEIWMRNQERLAGLIGNDPRIREMSVSLLERARNRVLMRELVSVPDLKLFSDTMTERLTNAGYGTALLVTTNLQVAATTGRARMRPGSFLRGDNAEFYKELFATGKPVVATPFKVPPPGLRGPGARLQNLGRRFRPDNQNPPPRQFPWGVQPQPPENPGEPPPPSLMQVLAPVKDSNGVVVGALSFLLRPEDEFTRVLSVARSGESGETFAFDRSGRLISQSRFDEQLKRVGLLTNDAAASSALTLELRDPGGDLTAGHVPANSNPTNWPLTRMVAEALAGGSGVTVIPERDYRGVPVVGAWRWLPDCDFGVVTKIDAREAYQPLYVLRRILMILIVLLAVASIAVAVFSYFNILWRRRFNMAQLKARKLGQYTLEDKIGEGSMGVVYKARHVLLRRETAVKLLLPTRADEDIIRQFEHEVRLTCQLSHPNTIQVYDYGHTPDGIFYYAMELLRGMTLSELVDRFGAQPESRVLHILIHVCESLKEAHAAGLIHRDIKLGNVFLCTRGGIPDTVKVLDFGLVRIIRDKDETITTAAHDAASRFLGTPQYMAPEIIRDPACADPRSDIYAVGAVGYQLLTGKPLFEGETVRDIFNHHLETQPEPPGARGGVSVSPILEQIILRCLEKDPARRPQNMTDLASSLGQCPAAGAWTESLRTDWWSRNKAAIETNQQRVDIKPASVAEATLKIDLNQRTD